MIAKNKFWHECVLPFEFIKLFKVHRKCVWRRKYKFCFASYSRRLNESTQNIKQISTDNFQDRVWTFDRIQETIYLSVINLVQLLLMGTICESLLDVKPQSSVLSYKHSSPDRESYVWCPDGHVRSTSATVTVRSVSLHQSLITRWTKNGLLRSRCCCSHHIILWGQSDWIVDADLLWLVVIEWTELTERFVIKKKKSATEQKLLKSFHWN